MLRKFAELVGLPSRSDVIYVPLLDGGSEDVRAVAARSVQLGQYVITGKNTDPNAQWAFPTGSLVRVAPSMLGLLAIERLNSGIVDPTSALLSAFPTDLKLAVVRVLKRLGEPVSGYNSFLDQSVLVEGARLNVLNRFISTKSPTAVTSLPPTTEQLVLAALLTRHSDGRIRERYMDALFVDVPWTIPFILTLVSEYVVEIADRAVAISDPAPASRYQVFAADNPTFMALIRSRVVCYWSWNHRPYRDAYDGSLRSWGGGRPMRFIDYPAYRFLAERGLWTGREARHLIRREQRART